MDKPNLIKKAGNFIQASARHTVDGFAKVSDEIAQQRMDICRKCEHFQSTNRICGICGCYLDVKTTWKGESCPIKKWLAVETKKPGSFANISEMLTKPPDVNINVMAKPCNCGGSPEDIIKEGS